MSRTGDSYSTRCGNGTSHSSCLDSSERELCKQQLREVQHQVDWTSIQVQQWQPPILGSGPDLVCVVEKQRESTSQKRTSF
ncbi:hypothetical protein MRX96_010147 [Rhipicephalus microplus]|uniref:uncharacterized protein LOC142776408 isoform X2 n=1 Tax=Rhipicephalus microplus TaxID=6941 RepID=UPI003F6B5724